MKYLKYFNTINERLMDVNKDVDYIYDLFFKKDVVKFNESGIITDGMFESNKLSTKDLKEPLSVKADKLNRCEILINKNGNFYKPSENIISLSVNFNAVSFIKSSGGLENAIKNLSSSKAEVLKYELSESRIKGSIHHELVHWLDETLHNKHITKKLKKAKEVGNWGRNVNSTKMEIQSQIHNIVQLKREYADIWDEMSFREMLIKSPSLDTIYSMLRGEEKKNWILDLKKRMFREGLLGKNMKNE